MSESSMFTDIIGMNEAFGNKGGNPFDVDWERLKHQCSNILDEYNELMNDGITPRSLKDTRDGLCDILVFTLGAYHFLGLDAEVDMREVYESNMSKLCATQEELDKTVFHYSTLGVQTYTGGEFPKAWVKSLKAQVGIDGKNYPENKFLKNISWKEPNFW